MEKIASKTIFDGFIIPDTSRCETQLLAELISEPKYIPIANRIIKHGMFTIERNNRCWNILNKLFSEHETIDIVTIGTKVDQSLLHDLAESTQRIGFLTESTIVDHCHTLARQSTRRLIFNKGLELLRMASDPECDFDMLVSMPNKIVEAIGNNSVIGESTTPIGQILDELAIEIEQKQVNEEHGIATKIPTGFKTLDNVFFNGGFDMGWLVVLSARPSVGKTTIMLEMAKNATMMGFPTIVYSLEMTKWQLAKKLVASTGIIEQYEMERCAYFDWARWESVNGELHNLGLAINDVARRMDDIANDIRNKCQLGKCKIAFIDYLGLINGNPRQSIYEKVSEFTRTLKLLANECQIPIVVLSQLNRNSDSENRTPQLRDLRDSGSIEQDADIVLMLNRENLTLNNCNVQMWVRKNRHGKVGTGIELIGNESFSMFQDNGEIAEENLIKQ